MSKTARAGTAPSDPSRQQAGIYPDACRHKSTTKCDPTRTKLRVSRYARLCEKDSPAPLKATQWLFCAGRAPPSTNLTAFSAEVLGVAPHRSDFSHSLTRCWAGGPDLPRSARLAETSR